MSSGPGEDLAPAFQAVTDADHSGWVVVTTCVFFIFSVLALVAKPLSRFRSFTPGIHDWVLVAAAVVALAEAACVVSACKHGLGRHRDDVDDSSFEVVAKYSYAALILSVVSQAATKISVALFLLVLSPYAVITFLCRTTIAVVAVWAISGCVALAVQCHLPKPWLWAAGACLDQQALYLYIAIMNVITDIALVAIPTYLMFLTKSAARYQVIALFSTRIVVPGFVIASQVSLASYFSSPSPDRTRDGVLPTIYTQIAINLSIITACIPGLKRVIDACCSDAAAITIAPPYAVAVSPKNSTWQARFRRWRTTQNQDKWTSIELQSMPSGPSTARPAQRSQPEMPRDGEPLGTWSGSTTCLTPTIIDEETDYHAHARDETRSCDTDLPQDSVNVRNGLD